MSSQVTVLIVDDHAIVREGLKQIALSDPSIAVTGEAATAHEALARIAREQFDVLVLDLSLPDRHGLELLPSIKAARPELAVLVLSVEREEEFALRCLRAGAAGYLEKRSVPQELVNAIKALAKGKRFLSAELAQHMILEPAGVDTSRPHDLLSQREFEVFLAIAAGKAVSQIARDLTLSVKTVNNHRARLMKKLGTKSTAELVRYAVRHELIR